MQVMNFTDVRNNLKSVFDAVVQNSDEVVVSRKNGENVVIISLDHYNSLNETDYLLRSPKNKKHLLDSIKEFKNGKYTEQDIIE